MDQQFTTPMMKQYEVIKKNYTDCLLLYRMGDFYELFLEDAKIGAKVLDITLTSRAKGKDGRIPMAGVPYHAIDSYLSKLVKAGYKVAICEQMTKPNSRGIIEREVVRVVTPGTILDEKALDKKENNFLISLFIEDKKLGIAACDISTGYFQTSEIEYGNLSQALQDQLGKISPVECILPEVLYNSADIIKILRVEHQLNINCFKTWDIYARQAKKLIKEHFQITTIESFGLSHKPLAAVATATLLGYLKETQKNNVKHITRIKTVEDHEYLQMDRSTIINLELFTTIREHESNGTLLSTIDYTNTAMGGRMLRTWIRKPLLKKTEIEQRYDAVETLLKNPELRKKLKEIVEHVSDVERMVSRLSVGIGNARDLVNLKLSLNSMLLIKRILSSADSALLTTICNNIKTELHHTVSDIGLTIIDEPPVSVREGGMIKPGISKDLDMFRSMVGGGKEWIAQLEITERKRTGISSLKVRFNRVFGFYIEISKANAHLVPEDYMRKQTLVNGERFITPQLKKQEEIILTAQEEIQSLEYTLFQSLLSRVLSSTTIIQQASSAIAQLDCLICFAELAEKNQYTRPTILESGELQITNGRHPVVEKLFSETQFVPNGVVLNSNQQLLIITGPNMAGKSVFIRQVALIVLMAQIGSFVPAEHAKLSVTDRIFVRSGASDVITSGLSTFMVEMVETAYILHHATANSLIVMDEIGRGTSTYDGISIAWAVAEYLVTNTNVYSRTLFATHYHELQDLAEKYPHKIKNYHMAVVEENGVPIFLHTLIPGGASASFGVAVARLAGVPDVIIENANKLLKEMENKHIGKSVSNTRSANQKEMSNKIIIEELKTIDLHRTTPLDALNKLAELQKKL